jgi:hypothetical protein
MSLGARLGTKINTKDTGCSFGNTRTSLRFLMTAFKGLSSSGVFRLPGVGATIEVSRIVMALIMRPCGNAIWDGVGGSGRVWAAADRVCHFPDVVVVRFQLFRAEIEFPVTCPEMPRAWPGLTAAFGGSYAQATEL